MNLNKVLLAGRLTKEPELKTIQSGSAVASASIAVNHNYTDKAGNKKEETEFINLIFWGRTAEVVAQYCQKGQEILVVGRMKTDQFENKQGQTVRSTKVVVESFQFGQKAKPKDDGSESGVGQIIDPGNLGNDDQIPF